MSVVNPNQTEITELQAHRKLLEERKPRSAFVSVAIGALRTAEDNLQWDGEATLRKQEEAAKAASSGAPGEGTGPTTASAGE